MQNLPVLENIKFINSSLQLYRVYQQNPSFLLSKLGLLLLKIRINSWKWQWKKNGMRNLQILFLFQNKNRT